MGGTVAMLTPHQFAQLPETIDKDLFQLITKNLFAKGAFEVIADHEGKMSVQRLKELTTQRDIVFSFEWGIDNKGRSCVRRVQKISDFLASKGLFLSSDDDQNSFMAQGLAGGNKLTTRDRVREKMANANCMVLFLTSRYFQKFSDEKDLDNILRIEFDEFLSKKGARMILPALFEAEATVTVDRPAPLGELFHHRRVVDVSNFEKEPKQLEDLYEYIIRSITPLREGGDYGSRNDDFASSRVGRYHHWLMENLPAGTLDHDQAMRYAELLVAENFDSMLRLMQVILHDDQYLGRIGIAPQHARLILAAVKRDAKDNFDAYKAAAITGIMAQKEAKQQEATTHEAASFGKQSEAAQVRSEQSSMGAEDDHSYTTIQTSYLQSMKQSHFEEKRQKLLDDRVKQRAKLAKQVADFEHAIKLEEEHKDRASWHAEVRHVLQTATMAELADRLRMLLNQLEANTANPLAAVDVEGTGGEEDDDWRFEVNANASLIVSSKRTRRRASAIAGAITGAAAGAATIVETSATAGTGAPAPRGDRSPGSSLSFTRFNSAASSSFSSTAPLVTMTPATSSRTMIKYGENARPMALTSKFPMSQDPLVLLDVLQNAAVVLRRMEELCVAHGNPMVQTALLEGLPKLLFMFLAETYIYHCHFLDIAMPSQTLSMLCVLCRSQPDEATIQEPTIFVLSQLGAVDVTLSLLKHHLDDRGVVAQALRFVDRMLTAAAPVNAIAFAEHYTRDSAGLLLLLLAIERFEVEDARIVIYAAAIVTKLLRSGSARCEEALRKHRASYILRALNEVVAQAAPSGGCHLSKEEMLSIARTVEDLYFSSALTVLPQRSYHHGSGDAGALDRDTLRGALVTQVNEHVLLPLLMAQLTIHAEDAFMAAPLLRCLGNMFYMRHDMKRRALAVHFPREIVRVLKFFQAELRHADPLRRAQAVATLAEALMTLSNSIDLAGPSDGFVFNANRNSTKARPRPPSSEWERCLQSYLAAGLAEVVCDIFDHFQLSDTLLHALLILLSKLLQGGNTLCCQRLVALGLADKLAVLLDARSSMPRALHEVTCQVLLGLISSDDVLVNATRRLVDKARCELWLVGNMRAHCRARHTGGHWTHLFSHSILANAAAAVQSSQPAQPWCRSCVYSAVLACRLCCHVERGQEMLQRLRGAGLALLLHAPPVDNAEAAVMMLSPPHSASDSRLVLDTVQEDSDPASALGDDLLFPIFPTLPGDDEPLVAYRSVEYTGNLSAQAFDDHVQHLFQLYQVQYGPRTQGERDFLAQVQSMSGPAHTLPISHKGIVE